MRQLQFAAALIGCCVALAALERRACAQPESEGASQPAAAGEHATEGGHAAETAHGSTNPLSVDPDLAVWTFIVFLMLLGVLWKFAWGPISEGLDKREQTIARFLSDAERSHEEAKELLADYQRKLGLAADEVRALLEEARRDAEHTKQEIMSEAKAAADAERLRALREIEAATDAAIKQLAERSADLAVELAGKIVGAKLTAGDHARLIQEAIAKFPSVTPSRN